MTAGPSTAVRVAALTDDRLLRRNVLLNLGSWVLPAAAALVAFPAAARGLGAARFGMLALGWAAVGLFSVFDFGLGRALTRIVAERSARSDSADIPDLVWTSWWMLAAIGGVLTMAGLVLAPYIARRVLHVPPGLEGEATAVVRWLSVGVLPMAHGVVLRGVLEAEQRFGTANRLRIPLGVATYLGPLLAIPLGGGASTAVGMLVLARTLYWLAHIPVLEHVMPGIARPRGYSRAAARELVNVGGWIAVSNVLSPIIVQADRIALAMLLPIAASGWYGTAVEVATKQWLFTAALQPVLFAALASSIVDHPARAAELMARALRVTLLVLFPVALGMVVLAEPALRWWMKEAFAPAGVDTLRLLAIGVFVNAAAQVPYAALQGGAGARAPAIVHLVELPLYAIVLALLVPRFGVLGAAAAFCLRMTLDAAVMWTLAASRVPGGASTSHRALALSTALVSALGAAWWWVARLG